MAKKINGMPGKPKKIKEDEKSTVWFKQDDTHDQPYVWSRVEILCSDIDIMKDNFGKAFIVMWIEMFKERTRELNYMAKEAGVKFTIQWTTESLLLSVYGYNESFEKYYEQIFSEIKETKADKEFFEAKRQQLLVATYNIIKAEPLNRYKQLLNDILVDGMLSIETQQQMIKDFTFDQFLEYS